VVVGRAGLAPGLGVSLGGGLTVGEVGAATIGAGLQLGGTLPTSPAGDLGSLGSGRVTALAEVRAGGLAAPYASVGPSLATFVFDPVHGEADPLQVAASPGLAARAGAGWPVAAHARLELAVEGGWDARPVTLVRDGLVVGKVGAMWASGGLVARFQ
jgi:hypothetical protein